MGTLLIVHHGHTLLNLPGRDERLRGESFHQFYGRYAHRLASLLSEAEASAKSNAVLTQVQEQRGASRDCS